MKKLLILVMATMIACLSTDSLTAAARSSTDAQKQRERGMQESFSRTSLRSRRSVAADIAIAAKRAAATGLESKAEAERKESKEEAVRRVSDAFKKELQAKVEGREKRIEELGICSICRELPTFTDVNPNVVPPCEKSAALHTMCKKCMIDFRKSESFSCPTCRQAYSDDAIEYIDYHLKNTNNLVSCGRSIQDDLRRIDEAVARYMNGPASFLNITYTISANNRNNRSLSIISPAGHMSPSGARNFFAGTVVVCVLLLCIKRMLGVDT